MRPWEPVLDDLVAPLLSSDVPLVFILGAGCSISSGAPTTPEAFRRLDSGLQRLRPHERNFAPDQSAQEKRDVLKSAFEKFSPGIGYLLLASLARTRQVYVINFNWDLGVEQAADKLDIKYKSVEANSKPKWRSFQLPKRQPGLRVLHVHGRLDGDPLARTTETSQFPPEVESMLKELWKFHKVCAGVDLGFELDFFNFTKGLSKRESPNSRPWYFSRGTSLDGHLEKLQRIEAVGRASVTPDFDFDLFMVGLAARLKRFPYAEFALVTPQLPKALQELCLPGNDQLTKLVLARRVGLAAEPQTGATTLALVVAYLKFLLRDGAQRPHLVEGLAATKADFGNSLATSSRSTEGSAIVVADAVLLGEPQDDASLLEILKLVGSSRYGDIILVAPLASVARLKASGERSFGDTFEAVCELRDGEPYSREVLTAFAQRLGAVPGFLRDIETGLVHFPEDCRAGRVRLRDGSGQPGADAELASDASLRRVATVARLIELSAREKTVAELERIAQVSMSSIPASTLARYVSIYTFEKTPWFQVVPGRRAQLDALLKEDAPQLGHVLQGRDIVLLFELDQWLRFVEVASGGDSRRGPEPEQFRRMTSALLDEPPTVNALSALLDSPSMDPWGATNVAYALVAGWERFDAAQRRKVLKDILARRNLRGCYAVTEAALFLGSATAREVWSTLGSACWDLLREDPAGKEICLVVDAFMWRPPPAEEQLVWADLVHDYFGGMNKTSPHAGALRFFAAYHLAGLEKLHPGWEAQDDSLAWTEEQSRRAAWLVEWHFVHFAFSRAISFRFGRNDKDLLCRALHEQRISDVDRFQRRLLTSMGQHASTAGRGFLAACLMAGKHDWLTQDAGERLMMELLEASAPDDIGVAAGMAGYEAPRRLARVRGAFKIEPRLSTVTRFVGAGAVLDDRPFTHQQFQFVHDVRGLWQALELRLPGFGREHLDRESEFEHFMQDVESGVAQLRQAEAAPPLSQVARVVEGIRTQTRLPSLEQAIPARSRTTTLGRHVLEVMLLMEADANSGTLPSPPSQNQLDLL